MSSIRITDSLRKEISSELLKGKFITEMDAIYKAAAALANDCYKEFYSMQAIFKKMQDIPDGWLPQLDKITCRFAGPKSDRIKMHFNGYSRFLPWKAHDEIESIGEFELKKRFRQIDLYMDVQLTLEKTDPLSIRFFELLHKGQAIEKEKKKLKDDLMGALYSATTTGKLCALWPEIEPIVAKLAPVESVNAKLPAKVLTGLNERLGLKKAA